MVLPLLEEFQIEQEMDEWMEDKNSSLQREHDTLKESQGVFREWKSQGGLPGRGRL